MLKPPTIDHLRDIAASRSALLCDAWGVIHDGVTLFPGAAEALLAFRRECGPVIILTNAPRPSEIIPPQLDRLGLPRDAYDAVVTSGDATRAEIAARLPLAAHRIGPAKDDALFEGLEMRFAPLEEAGFIICTGLRDELNEAPEDYRAELTLAARRKLPMISANPDIVVRWGGRLIWCAGALGELYRSLGGAVINAGKPHPPIYALARRAAEAAAGRTLAASDFLAVGDGLQTDIAGANAQGFAAVYVAGAGGVHDGTDPADSLAAADLDAVAVMERLQW